MSLEIHFADNGFVVNKESEEYAPYVFDVDTNGLEAIQALLIYVLEFIGYSGSKNAPERILITIEKTSHE